MEDMDEWISRLEEDMDELISRLEEAEKQIRIVKEELKEVFEV